MTPAQSTRFPVRQHAASAVLPAAALVAAVLLTGCGSEQPLPGETGFLNGAGGVDTRVGPVLLRDVSIDEPDDGVYAPGDLVRLRVTLFNEAATQDALSAVSTPAASDSLLLVDRDCDGTTERVGEVLLPPQPTVRTPAPGVPDGPEVYDAVQLQLDEQLRSGESVPVTFTFREAGSTTVQVPVELSGAPLLADDAACEPAQT